MTPNTTTNCDTVRPGTRVLIATEIDGMVTANQIRQDASGKLYVAAIECSWWDGRARHVEWLEPWQVRPIPEPMGFNAHE